jgi:excisionase family DNA binding protein
MEKEILTMEEAAELFGVSVKTFIKLLKEEKVPARKIGREWRFSKKALIDWLSMGDSQVYSDSEAEAKDFFNEVATEWEEISSNYYDQSIKNRLLDMKLLKKSMTVVDLGAGDGYISRAVAKFAKKVIAVDISGEMLRELGKKAVAAGLKNIDLLEGDGQDLSLPASSTDIVCANMYLHHIREPELRSRKCTGFSSPEGKFFWLILPSIKITN